MTPLTPKEWKNGSSGKTPISAAALKDIEERLAAYSDIEKARAEAVETEKLAKASNLSDITNVATARSNLGLGTAATKNSGAAGEAGKVLASDDPLLSSVVSSSSTGGVPAWAASTEYALNHLVSFAGAIYICVKAHKSGESFSGPGTNWAVLTGAEAVKEVSAASTAQTIKLSEGTTWGITFSAASCAFTLPTPEKGKSFTLILRQDGTGGRLATWPATALWPGGVYPALSTAKNAVDVISFVCEDGANWLGFPGGNAFTTGGASAEVTAVVAAYVAAQIAAKTAVFYETHTFGVPDTIAVPSGDTDFIPPFFVELGSKQTAKLVKMRHRINGGTSATIKLVRTKSGGEQEDLTGFTAEVKASGTTDPTDIALASDDKIGLVVTAVSGTPKNLSVTLVIEHTVTLT